MKGFLASIFSAIISIIVGLFTSLVVYGEKTTAGSDVFLYSAGITGITLLALFAYMDSGN